MVLSLAFSIATNSIVFTILNAVWKPLPYPNSKNLVMVHFATRDGQSFVPINLSDCRDIQNRASIFEGVGCMQATELVFRDESGSNLEAERFVVGRITHEIPQILRISPQIGRWFTPSDGYSGAPLLVVLSHRLWQNRYGESGTVIGKTVWIGNDVATIVGVAPSTFDLPNSNVAFWIPLSELDSSTDRSQRLLMLGRLQPSVTLQGANSELERFEASSPEGARGDSGRVFVIQFDIQSTTAARLTLFVQYVMVLILLIACGNLAMMALAMATAEKKNLAVLMALGASRSRIVLQLVTRSLLVSTSGGILALGFVAAVGMPLLMQFLPPEFPRRNELSIDMTVFGFTMLLSVATGVGCGLIPALHVSRRSLIETLQQVTQLVTTDRKSRTLWNSFVVAQICITMVLLVGANMAITSYERLSTLIVPFDTRELKAFQIEINDAPGNPPMVDTIAS